MARLALAHNYPQHCARWAETLAPTLLLQKTQSQSTFLVQTVIRPGDQNSRQSPQMGLPIISARSRPQNLPIFAGDTKSRQEWLSMSHRSTVSSQCGFASLAASSSYDSEEEIRVQRLARGIRALRSYQGSQGHRATRPLPLRYDSVSATPSGTMLMPPIKAQGPS